MTAAAAGLGSEFKLGTNASPIVYTKVAEVLSISGPEISAEEIDVTSLDSTGGFKEYITGLKDGGTVSIEANWIKGNAQQITMRDAVASGATVNLQIVFADSPQTIATFIGKVTSFGMGADPSSQLKASLSVRISGAITWT
tara:strand:- start:3061 stop:3483 length:423 start_codon:yes stop_codon:yes gene_type:complete